jgi:hypothetical protein
MEKWRPASGERVNGLHNVLYDMQCGMKKNSDGSEISDILTAGLVIGIADHVKAPREQNETITITIRWELGPRPSLAASRFFP